MCQNYVLDKIHENKLKVICEKSDRENIFEE